MKQCERYKSRAVWGTMSVLTALQIILSFFLYNRSGLEVLRNAGWVILWIACLFGVIPLFTFRKRGGVPKGQEYIHTTVLVDTGIYAVVRHPQYLSFMLVNIGLILVAQDWLITVIGTVAAILNYVIALEADQDGIEKFGDDYKRYMQKVPRLNFVLGLIRLVQRGKEK